MRKSLYRNTLKVLMIIAISVFLLNDFYTISYFKNLVYFDENFAAESYEDIIQSIAFKKEEDIIIEDLDLYIVNPTDILIAKNVQYNPIIHFSIEGNIKNYILHINSIELNEDESRVQLPLNISLKQFLNKMFEDSSNITGEIHIRYLNDYFDKVYKIKFTRNYIVNNFLKNMDIEQVEEFNDSNKYEILNQVIQKTQEYLQSMQTNQETLDLQESASREYFREEIEQSFTEKILNQSPIIREQNNLIGNAVTTDIITNKIYDEYIEKQDENENIKAEIY